MPRTIVQVAIPSPLRRAFDYLVPEGMELAPGVRVRVPFGRRETVGVVVGSGTAPTVDEGRLKIVAAVLDPAPLFPPDLARLLARATDYYHHPIGEVYATALPVRLRQGEPAQVRALLRYGLSAAGRDADPASLRRAPRQGALLARLQAQSELDAEALVTEPADRGALARLVEKGWVVAIERPCLPVPEAGAGPIPVLNGGQADAVAAVTDGLGRYGTFLLDGVTGSGKTEVYLQLIEAVLARGEQALVLVPEIGLTPQLLERFRRRFAVPIAVLHSGLTDQERLCAWLSARAGDAPIVVGTRSAIFTPLARPGLLVVDEEHDPSFKQQDGFRYSARDLAVMRAHIARVPVVLGSATPSLESLHNCAEGRYTRLHLPERAGAAVQPRVRLVDLRAQKTEDGLAPSLLQAMEDHLARGNQVLLFLNRRGFAPVLLCHDCGHLFDCRRCDAHLTLYAGERRLRCHHCGSEAPVPRQCPECGGTELRPVGKGTERIEEALAKRFGEGVVRIDRDSTRRKGALESMLERVHEGEARVLIGTQMLAKGHHFPNVTLVGILDADQGLFSPDFRGPERLAQLIIQVAGRAGRADRPGEVLIQTHHPDHPLLGRLMAHDYSGFARDALGERRATHLPPYGHLALLRAEANDLAAANAFLTAARRHAEAHGIGGVSLLGPVPALMERRAGRHRSHLLLDAPRRGDLHRLLEVWAPELETLPEGRKARWNLDVDPAELS